MSKMANDFNVKPTLPQPNKALISDVINHGYSSAVCHYFSCNVIETQLSRILPIVEAVSKSSGAHVGVFFEVFEYRPVYWPKILLTYTKGNTCRTVQSVSALEGKYVGIYSGFPQGGEAASRSAVMQTAAALRMFIHENFARECHCHVYFDLLKEQVQVLEPSGKRIAGDQGRFVEDLARAREVGSLDVLLSPRAMEFLEIFNQSIDGSVKFVLLWTALTLQIGHVSRYKKREEWCRKDLKSEVINGSLFEFFLSRNRALKEGAIIDLSAREEYLLKSILRLATLREGPARRVLVTRVEEVVLDPTVEQF